MKTTEFDPSQPIAALMSLTPGGRPPMARDAEPAPARRGPEASRKAEDDQPLHDPAVDALKRDLADASLSVGFFQVEGSSSPVIRVYDRKTGEVVRQIPEEQVLRLRERFAEFLGVIADKKA